MRDRRGSNGECLADRPHVVDADNLHALDGQSQATRRPFALVRSASLSPMSLPKKPLREWPTSSGQPSVVEFAAMTHECDVVLVRFAEADARVEADSLA